MEPMAEAPAFSSADPLTPPPPPDAAPLTPRALRVVSDWCWRLLVVGVVVALAVWAAAYLSFVVVPLIVALMASALLDPVRRRLMRFGLSDVWASTFAFLLGVLFITSVVTLATGQIVTHFDQLTERATDGLSEISRLLGLHGDSLSKGFERAMDRFRRDPENAISGTFSILSTTTGLLASGVLALISTLFFMRDRHRIRNNLTSWLPVPSRPYVERAGSAAWRVLVSYMQVTLTSAVVDSVFIGGAAAIAGLPVAFALGLIVFLSAFIPTVGAIASGALVVLVALVTKNVATAVALAVVVVVVQQLDANVMYPILASKRLSIHPLGALLLVAAGAVVGGIVGALVAVPTATMIGAIVKSIRLETLETPGLNRSP